MAYGQLAGAEREEEGGRGDEKSKDVKSGFSGFQSCFDFLPSVFYLGIVDFVVSSLRLIDPVHSRIHASVESCDRFCNSPPTPDRTYQH